MVYPQALSALFAAVALAAPAPVSQTPPESSAPVSYKSTATYESSPASSATGYPAGSSSGASYPDTPSAGNTASAGDAELVKQLTEAATQLDRFKLLPNADDHVFDFANPPIDSAVTTGAGGHTVAATRLTFPALVGTGGSMTVGFLGPCGFNTPHVHPRSSELNIPVQGELVSEFFLENGAKPLTSRLGTFQMTVFPQGAIHTEFNPGCGNATFVAGFQSEDPGVTQLAQGLFALEDDLLQAAFASDFTFDGRDIDTFRAAIPPNVALGVESCLQKCGIAKR